MPDDYMDAVNIMWNSLGGARIMLGAKHQMGSKSDAGNPKLSFKIGRGPKKVTHITIELLPNDTYKVEFLRCVGFERKTLAEFTGIYNDNLLSLIRENTGLETSL